MFNNGGSEYTCDSLRNFIRKSIKTYENESQNHILPDVLTLYSPVLWLSFADAVVDGPNKAFKISIR